LFLRRARPLSRLQQAKNSHEGGRQSFSRTALESWQKAKFGWGQILPFFAQLGSLKIQNRAKSRKAGQNQRNS